MKCKTKNKLFREMSNLYRQEKLEDEFSRLQKYGVKKAREMKLTEKDIERLIFKGR